MHRFLLFSFVLFSTAVFSQSDSIIALNGKISSYISNLEGVYVINLKTEQTVFTDENGAFFIKAAVGDVLVFSGLQFERKEVVLYAEDFEKKPLVIYLNAMVNELNEVVIKNYSRINAASLGIIPFDQKKYTPAERKYATASSARLNPGGFDPVLNLISGRSAMLKKEMAVEKKEYYIAMLEKMFVETHFVNTLKIPLDYVKGFKYYAVDNQKFTKILEMKNKTTIAFLLGELAQKYKDILACEKE